MTKFISNEMVKGTMIKTFPYLVATVLLLFGISELARACTTAVISGKATVDGRPLLWKNRDTSATQHNEVILLEGTGYRAVAVVNAGSTKSVWMGANSAGFCIENSLSRDLKPAIPAQSATTAASDVAEQTSKASGPGNGQLMKLALQQCATVEDFRKLLDETNRSGRTTLANFGVIDASGGAAMFETSPAGYTMFDANDPRVAPEGVIVRSNFATTAQDLPPIPEAHQVGELYSGDRYSRACHLLGDIDLAQESKRASLNFILRNMTRDMSDASGTPYPGSVNDPDGLLPPTISTESTISRTTTVSAAVFHGVRPGEDPRLTTMWTILGDPKFSVAVPCWASTLSVADDLSSPSGGELGEIAVTLRDWNMTLDRTGVRTSGLKGIWQDIWPLEDQLVEETLAMRASWAKGSLNAAEMTNFHASMVARAMAAMDQELLEAKQSALAPPETIRVAIYDHSDGTAKGPKSLAKFLTPENGFICQRLSPDDIRSGGLDGFQVIIMPGGSGSKQAEMLEASGCETVQAFVDSGGGYIGICAGSYLASSQYSWSLNLINARVWDRAHWARGTGTVTIGLSDTGEDFFDRSSTPVEVFYGQGPLLVPGDNPNLPRYEVLASYESEVASKGAPVGAMVGTHAIVRSQYGAGRVMCFSPHPESSSGPNSLITAGVRWVAAE